ncbi:hypothetical protein CCHR01_18760 [Colletotrichum chrysophilum]|uniref:Secreted protein n=1 Tax=Colletotrichum chrysophilum TaxID=1836956 RepID=A0AAD9EB58_9PEZI|nr:hypothetical protein K456DRAFT_52918 [Colletotrichum gloeosporioides 23]KAK1838621.1 hypothetical protein CCHR01_18760 [Colletotrichum chrysophilum]
MLLFLLCLVVWIGIPRSASSPLHISSSRGPSLFLSSSAAPASLIAHFLLLHQTDSSPASTLSKTASWHLRQ